jgi:hypothetical protein
MTNKDRIETLERQVKLLTKALELVYRISQEYTKALENLDQRERLNDKRLSWVDQDILNLQRGNNNNNDWRPL